VSRYIDWAIPAPECDGKGKKISVHACYRPWGLHGLEAPRFRDIRLLKVAGLSALRTGRFYTTGKYSWYSFLLKAQSTLGP